MKAILLNFELALGVQVNFLKSGFIGINMGSSFLDTSGDFLHSKIVSLPFKYLGLVVRVNPRVESR